MKSIYPGKICASIATQYVEHAKTLAKGAQQYADVIEIRLDSLEQPEIFPFIDSIDKPLLFTNRASWEGGSFPGNEEERLALLYDAVDQKAAYIDIEVKTEDQYKLPLIQHAAHRYCTTIVSWHSFDHTPSKQALASIVQEQYRSGAQVGKIVTTANNHSDVLRVLDLQNQAQEMDFSLIAFCMGPIGTISRVATLGLGGFMTYASADSGSATAPGQLSITTLCQIFKDIYHGD